MSSRMNASSLFKLDTLRMRLMVVVVLLMYFNSGGNLEDCRLFKDYADDGGDDIYDDDDDFHRLINLVCPDKGLLGPDRVALRLNPWFNNM